MQPVRIPGKMGLPLHTSEDFSFEGLDDLVTGTQHFWFGEVAGEQEENKSGTNQQIFSRFFGVSQLY